MWDSRVVTSSCFQGLIIQSHHCFLRLRSRREKSLWKCAKIKFEALNVCASKMSAISFPSSLILTPFGKPGSKHKRKRKHSSKPIKAILGQFMCHITDNLSIYILLIAEKKALPCIWEQYQQNLIRARAKTWWAFRYGTKRTPPTAAAATYDKNSTFKFNR